MSTPLPPLTPAGEHFGRAFCAPAGTSGTPLDQLPPDVQQCVTTVGRNWEADIDRRLGVMAPAPPEVYRARLQSDTGSEVGTLTYADGVVTLCWDRPPADVTTGSRCQVLGNGFDAFRAAQSLLRQFGLLTTEPTG